MVSVLRRLFSPQLDPRIGELATLVEQLQRQVRALEAERLELVTEWVKTRDQVLRYMKRAGALRGRIGENLGEDEDELDSELLRLKFPKGA